MKGKLTIWSSVIFSTCVVETGSKVLEGLTFVYSNYRIACDWATSCSLLSISDASVPVS